MVRPRIIGGKVYKGCAARLVVCVVVILDGSSWQNVWINFCIVRCSVSLSFVELAKGGNLNAIDSFCVRRLGRKSNVFSIVLVQFRETSCIGRCVPEWCREKAG